MTVPIKQPFGAHVRVRPVEPRSEKNGNSTEESGQKGVMSGAQFLTRAEREHSPRRQPCVVQRPRPLQSRRPRAAAARPRGAETHSLSVAVEGCRNSRSAGLICFR